MYFKFGIYNVEQRQINVVYFNVDMNNVRQRRSNVIFTGELHNAVKRQNNVLKMNFCKKKRKSLQVEYTEFKVLTTIS